MPAYAHGRLAHRQHSAQQLFRKNYHKFACIVTGFDPRVSGSRVRRSTDWATTSPQSQGVTIACVCVCAQVCKGVCVSVYTGVRVYVRSCMRTSVCVCARERTCYADLRFY